MISMRLSLASLLVLGAAAAAALARTSSPPIRQGPTLADLAWLAGHWSSERAGTRTEEVWLTPSGGLLLGMNRAVTAAGRGTFEFLRIEQRAQGIVYVASPSGRGETVFPLADVGARFVLFENPEHDFPQRIRYELDDAGRMQARVSAGQGDQERALEWSWTRLP
jgi:hypothetical protein